MQVHRRQNPGAPGSACAGLRPAENHGIAKAMHIAQRVVAFLLLAEILQPARAIDANRLAYLDSTDPFYVGLAFPRLATPQWVGEAGVEAVITLGIDDLRGNADKYEEFL